MPISVEQLEPKIYIARWSGIVTIEETFTEMETVSRMAHENGEAHYVLLLDLTDVRKIPTDVSNMRRIADAASNLNSFVVIKAPPIAQIIGAMVDKVSKRDFKFVDSFDEGVILARSLLHQDVELRL